MVVKSLQMSEMPGKNLQARYCSESADWHILEGANVSYWIYDLLKFQTEFVSFSIYAPDKFVKINTSNKMGALSDKSDRKRGFLWKAEAEKVGV